MDISFKSENEKFNYRVCAMIISDNTILAMHDERAPYYYLPGRRVKMEKQQNMLLLERFKKSLVLLQGLFVRCG